MNSIDKIKYHVPTQVINTINELVKLYQVEVLKKWRADCNHEISRRQEAGEDTYPLFYEKEYLEMVLR
jgi:hypothetical protein